MTPLDRAVELLDRALSYTRVILADVRPNDLDRPTPCAAWDLSELLAHMDDALTAFTEAASGYVEPPRPARVPVPQTAQLQTKACGLLAAWSTQRPQVTRVGNLFMPTELLVEAAALEIAVHGWDVAESLGTERPLPPELADALLLVATGLVTPADRGVRFGDLVTLPARADAGGLLLGYLGRSSRNAWSKQNSRQSATGY